MLVVGHSLGLWALLYSWLSLSFFPKVIFNSRETDSRRALESLTGAMDKGGLFRL